MLHGTTHMRIFNAPRAWESRHAGAARRLTAMNGDFEKITSPGGKTSIGKKVTSFCEAKPGRPPGDRGNGTKKSQPPSGGRDVSTGGEAACPRLRRTYCRPCRNRPSVLSVTSTWLTTQLLAKSENSRRSPSFFSENAFRKSKTAWVHSMCSLTWASYSG